MLLLLSLKRRRQVATGIQAQLRVSSKHQGQCNKHKQIFTHYKQTDKGNQEGYVT